MRQCLSYSVPYGRTRQCLVCITDARGHSSHALPIVMEKRLVQVRAQEDEVRAIANELLNREVELTKLLADLLSQHQVSYQAAASF